MRILRIAVLTASVVGVSLIAMGAQGCGTELHRASVAAASIGASAQTAATVNHDLIAAGVETQEQGAAVATYILKLAKANDVFVADLKTAEASGGQLTTAQAITDFKAVVDSASALQTAGILGIKNPAAVARFNGIVADIQAQITVIQGLLGSTSSRGPERNRKPWLPSSAALALALTPEEIEALIALAVAAGSSLVPKLMSLRGDTDPQLLVSALASDQAAEEQAVADGAKQE